MGWVPLQKCDFSGILHALKEMLIENDFKMHIKKNKKEKYSKIDIKD